MLWVSCNKNGLLFSVRGASRDSESDVDIRFWRLKSVPALKGLNRQARLQSFLIRCINPFKPEFTIVTFIHYKSWIAVAILDL